MPGRLALAFPHSVYVMLLLAVPTWQVRAAPDVTIYLGCGCFWHIQYEIVQAERSLLGRSNAQLSALVGYGGGRAPNSFGTACYPPYSSQDRALGHAEVVAVSVPEAKLSQIAAAYWNLFVGINRVDVQDKGPDYRAVLGFSGGLQSSTAAIFRAAQGTQKFSMMEGKGADADTLGQALVWVYDSDKFPFYQGEAYHQFHDDFQGPQYPQSYNDLRDQLLRECRLRPTPCSGDEQFLTAAPKNCNATGTTGSRGISTGGTKISGGGSGGDSGGGNDNVVLSSKGMQGNLLPGGGSGGGLGNQVTSSRGPSTAGAVGSSSRVRSSHASKVFALVALSCCFRA